MMQKPLPHNRRRARAPAARCRVPQLSRAARAWRFVEMALLYGAAPFVVDRAVHQEGIPVFIALLPVLAIMLMFLVARPHVLAAPRAVARVLARAARLHPRRVRGRRRQASPPTSPISTPTGSSSSRATVPTTYLRIMLLYPLMSVAVQELVYRTFYFHRYGLLFGSAWWLAIVLNGVLFGARPHRHRHAAGRLRHHGHGRAVCLALCVTRSFWAVFIEHTLWGALVFTVGLGRYFFTGVGILTWR